MGLCSRIPGPVVLLMFISDMLFSQGFAEPGRQSPHHTVAFYNVENLFDVYDDPGKNDEEFLPGGARGWNNDRYFRKLYSVYRVIAALGGWSPPSVVGLCEVENERVLRDLVGKTPLSGFNYRYVHFESPDRRGVDVALIYRKDCFQVVSSRAINVSGGPAKTGLQSGNPSKLSEPESGLRQLQPSVELAYPGDESDSNNLPFEMKTRDVLYVKGILGSCDTIHVFVNHWPSNYGGYLESLPKRVYVAKVVRSVIDSLFRMDSCVRIIAMGDLNDTGDSEPVKMLTGGDDLSAGRMYPVLGPRQPLTGTMKYRGFWYVYDHILVSAGLLMCGDGFNCQGREGMIFSPSFLLEEDVSYTGQKPRRTFIGYRYNGGFSDHLPVLFEIVPTGKDWR